MPKKGYKQTEEHKEKLRIAHKNKHYSFETEFKDGIKHPSYIDGRTLKKYYCIDCRKEIVYGAKRCRSCASREVGNRFEVKKKKSKTMKKVWQNSKFRKKHKDILHKHHIDLDGDDKRVLFLTNSEHRKLHVKAYNYLVEIGKIDDYLIWFRDTILNLIK